MKYYITATLLFCLTILSHARIYPIEGAQLNFTQIMFEYENIDQADQYLIQIAEDNGSESFIEVVVEQKDFSTATMISYLEFGHKYVWRYSGIVSGKQTEWKGPFHFEIQADPTIGINSGRFNILVNDQLNNKGGLISIGCSKTIIDRKGKDVWYLPLLNKRIFIPREMIYEVRVSSAGTLLLYSSTSLTSGIALVCETNLEGDILWQAPNDGQVSGDTTEYYHHDFKRLKNGNYMILGCKYVWREVPEDVDLSSIRTINIDSSGAVRKVKFLFNTIIEYNKERKAIWSWNFSDHITNEELFGKGVVTNSSRRELPSSAELYGHMNSFDIDTAGEFLVAGFREISQAIKIQKNTGKIIQRYGLKTPDSQRGGLTFINQHDVSLMPNGNICLFDNNNNLKDKSASSRAVEFSQSTKSKPSKLVWYFDCKMDTLTMGRASKFGGVEYLGGENMLVCMGSLNRAIEVNKKTKKVVWDCFYKLKEGVESGNAMYRVHYTSSLYPCYFTVQASKPSEGITTEIRIFNEGTAADSYTISTHTPSGDLMKTVHSETIDPGADQQFNLEKMGFSNLEKGGFVNIVSVANPDFLRTIFWDGSTQK